MQGNCLTRELWSTIDFAEIHWHIRPLANNGRQGGADMVRELGRLTALAALLIVAQGAPWVRAQALDEPRPIPGGGVDDSDLVLPDGRPLPQLPVHVLGEWDRDDFRVYRWQADLALTGGEFEGKITLPDFPVVLPLTVQGAQKGDIIEFSVRMNGKEISYFAGHLAGTSLVGSFEGVAGQKGDWSGSWFPDTLTADGWLE